MTTTAQSSLPSKLTSTTISSSSSSPSPSPPLYSTGINSKTNTNTTSEWSTNPFSYATDNENDPLIPPTSSLTGLAHTNSISPSSSTPSSSRSPRDKIKMDNNGHSQLSNGRYGYDYDGDQNQSSRSPTMPSCHHAANIIHRQALILHTP
ncbi:uncharacterized protein L199_008404 [Kwoniella botswanensis]|uniref:uncharacterized protein n=1 Tax=Kwoniella botswanensis TaxID=1268659 RepID=UPI00315CEF7A